MHQHRFEQYWTVHYIIDTTTITTLRRSSSTKGATAVQEHFSNIFTKPTLIPEFLKIARKLNHSLNEHLCTDKRYSPSWQMILLQKWQTTSLSSCKLQAQQQSTLFFFFLILQAFVASSQRELRLLSSPLGRVHRNLSPLASEPLTPPSLPAQPRISPVYRFTRGTACANSALVCSPSSECAKLTGSTWLRCTHWPPCLLVSEMPFDCNDWSRILLKQFKNPPFFDPQSLFYQTFFQGY